MATWINGGLNLIASAVQSPGVNCAVAWVDFVPGCGTLSSAITAGVSQMSLSLDAVLPANLSAGQQLTVTDGTNTETVTVAGGGASAGATSIPINSWTPAHSYAAHATGVCPTPAATDTALYNGSGAVRISAVPGSAGANPGESLCSGYFDGTQPTAVYMLVGYFGGSTATATAGTGTLLVEDIQYWNHVQNSDSVSAQLDNTI